MDITELMYKEFVTKKLTTAISNYVTGTVHVVITEHNAHVTILNNDRVTYRCKVERLGDMVQDGFVPTDVIEYLAGKITIDYADYIFTKYFEEK